MEYLRHACGKSIIINFCGSIARVREKLQPTAMKKAHLQLGTVSVQLATLCYYYYLRVSHHFVTGSWLSSAVMKL